ncbi:hypothetical protein MMC11_000047 [Xylographa trunciseda]|nr:hypothetical protein [Xylographa trunciseda]
MESKSRSQIQPRTLSPARSSGASPVSPKKAAATTPVTSSGLQSAQTYIDLGWTGPHITFGSGYDVAHRTLRSSALESFTPQSSSTDRKYTPNIHTITTSEELKSRIKADVNATIPLEGAKIEATSSYLRSVQTSKTSLVQILEEIIEDPPVRAKTEQLKLKPDALKLLKKSVEEFQQKYGEYFVYGYVSRARFSAICTIKTSSEAVRDKIRASLTAKATDVGEIAATLERSLQNNSDFAQVDIHMEIDRLKGEEPAKRHIFKTDEVLSAFDKFQKDFVTVPFMALLCHYSVISSFPLPQNQFEYLGGQLAAAYQNLYIAQTDLISSPMVQAASFTHRITKVCDEIKQLDVGNEDAVSETKKHVQECTDETDRWRLRYDLRLDAVKLASKSMADNIGKEIEASYQREWSSGLLGVNGNRKYDLLKDDITTQREQFKVGWEHGRQRGKFLLGRSDKQIIGFQIISHRNDNSNGSYKLHKGSILDSEMQVEFITGFSRGCDWVAEVWMVSKVTYEVKPDWKQ